MTKNELIELVQTNINGGQFNLDIWKKAHPLIVEKYLSLALNAAMFNAFKKTPSNYELYSKWVNNLSIYSEGDRYYVDLPISVAQNTTRGNNVIKIAYTDDDNKLTFLPASVVHGSALYRLGTLGRHGIIVYTQQDNKVWFKNLDKDIENVDICVIRPFEDYDENEEIGIPAGQEDFVMSFILKYFQSQKPNTHTTDNNSNS